MRNVKIAIVGAGWWATENHIPVLQSFPGVEVAGVCSLNPQELSAIQARFGVARATCDFEELLAIPGLEGVLVSSPHHLHYQHASRALERGLHVVCEKPMTLETWQARKLGELVQREQRHFLIPFGWNYTELAAAAKARIDAGDIGQIEHVHCHMASALRDLFSGQRPWFVENAFLPPKSETWSNASTGGGFAHGQLTHALGLLFYVTGLQPAEVFALIGHSSTGADLFNAISCRFTSGATGMVGGAATMPPKSTYQIDIRLFGSQGMLLLDIERPRLEVMRDDGQRFVFDRHDEPGAYRCVEPLRTFVQLVRGEEVENRSTVEIGIRTVELLDAAFRSAQTRQLVEA